MIAGLLIALREIAKCNNAGDCERAHQHALADDALREFAEDGPGLDDDDVLCNRLHLAWQYMGITYCDVEQILATVTAHLRAMSNDR